MTISLLWIGLMLLAVRVIPPMPGRPLGKPSDGLRSQPEVPGSQSRLRPVGGGLVRALGGFVVHRTRRSIPWNRLPGAGPDINKQVGQGVATAAVLGLRVVWLAPFGFLIGWQLSAIRQRTMRERRIRRLEEAFPDFIDLLRLALEAGCSLPLALRSLAESDRSALRPELVRVVADMQDGASLITALEALVARTGEVVRPLAAALIASERYGLPLRDTLEALSLEAKAARRRRAEVAARRLPITMLFPLITCTLPAFALLTVVPLLGSGLQSLRW